MRRLPPGVFPVVILLLLLLLVACGCTGALGIPAGPPGFLTAEWEKIRQACALAPGTEALIQDLSFSFDPSAGELQSLQLQFAAVESGESAVYTVMLDPNGGADYLVHRSVSSPRTAPLIVDDARVPVDDVFTAIDGLGLDLIAPPGDERWRLHLRVATEEGRVYGLVDRMFLNECFDETYLVQDGRIHKLGQEETVVVSGVNVTLQAWTAPARGETANTVASRQFILDLSEKVERVRVKRPDLADGEKMQAARYVDLTGDGKCVPVYLVGWPSDPDLQFPDQRRLVIGDGPDVATVALPPSDGFHGTDFRLRDFTGDGRPEFAFLDIIGGSGGLAALSVYAFEDAVLRPVFEFAPSAHYPEVYNEHLGGERIRVSLPLHGVAWEYELENSGYHRWDEDKLRFSRSWIDHFRLRV